MSSPNTCLMFFIHFLVPLNQIELVKQMERKSQIEILKFYKGAFVNLTKDEICSKFEKFLLSGDNYNNFLLPKLKDKKKITDLSPEEIYRIGYLLPRTKDPRTKNYLLVSDFFRDIKQYFEYNNSISTKYMSLKANKYYEVYKLKLEDIVRNSENK